MNMDDNPYQVIHHPACLLAVGSMCTCRLELGPQAFSEDQGSRQVPQNGGFTDRPCSFRTALPKEKVPKKVPEVRV